MHVVLDKDNAPVINHNSAHALEVIVHGQMIPHARAAPPALVQDHVTPHVMLRQTFAKQAQTTVLLQMAELILVLVTKMLGVLLRTIIRQHIAVVALNTSVTQAATNGLHITNHFSFAQQAQL